ncbi:MAG: hypothetical protein ACR2HG_12290 [Pyrinomonadaceae bacterium]
MKRYNSDEEIFAVVRGFEYGAIAREDWHHAEHLTVACYYAFHHSFEEAAGKMRDGIFNLLKSFEIDLSKEMPYHETLTIFWMKIIFGVVQNKNGASFLETVNRVLEIGDDKDLPLKFYSRERLFSDEARRNFIESDLSSDDF